MVSHIGQGIAFIGVSIFAGWFAVQAVSSGDAQAGGDPADEIAAQADAIAASVEADYGASEDEGDWNPSMLCSDEQVLDNVETARREWLARLMTEMAEEGSYILPRSGNPISEGAANARITWPDGTTFVRMRETGGDMSGNAVEVRCSGALEIRDAFKLPDYNWSPVFLTLPDTTFVITAGADGFSLDYPDQQRETEAAVFHIAGEQLPLRRMREISAGRE